MLLPPNIVLWTIKIILNPKFRIFLEALRKAGYSESTIRQYKKTCRLFNRLHGYKLHTRL